MPGLDPGELNCPIEIRREVLRDDGKGGQIAEWVPVARPWAKVTSQNGREAVISGALQGISAWQIEIYYRDDVRTTDQIRMDNIDLNIRTAVDPDRRRERLVILADTGSVEV